MNPNKLDNMPYADHSVPVRVMLLFAVISMFPVPTRAAPLRLVKGVVQCACGAQTCACSVQNVGVGVCANMCMWFACTMCVLYDIPPLSKEASAFTKVTVSVNSCTNSADYTNS